LADLGRSHLGGQSGPPRHRGPFPWQRRAQRLACERRSILARPLRRGIGSHRLRHDRRRGARPRPATPRADPLPIPPPPPPPPSPPPPMTTKPRSLATLHASLIECRKCDRLVAWREHIAQEKRRAYRDETYWGRPVPGFGDPKASLILVGLAPGAHGANRTGR